MKVKVFGHNIERFSSFYLPFFELVLLISIANEFLCIVFLKSWYLWIFVSTPLREKRLEFLLMCSCKFVVLKYLKKVQLIPFFWFLNSKFFITIHLMLFISFEWVFFLKEYIEIKEMCITSRVSLGTMELVYPKDISLRTNDTRSVWRRFENFIQSFFKLSEEYFHFRNKNLLCVNEILLVKSLLNNLWTK